MLCCGQDPQFLSYAGKIHAVKLEEAAKLLKFHASKVQQASTRCRLPRKVAAAAVMLLQRVYLHISVLDRDPADLTMCCIYLACKASLAQCEQLSID